MSRIRRILHPTDFSRASTPAFKRAVEMAKANRSQLVVAHVLVPSMPIVGDGYISPQVYEDLDAAARSAQDAAPTAYTEWGGGASNDDSYNLEAFVAAEVTLGSHLAEQLAVAFTAPAQRMIGQYLIDLVDEAGYLPPDLGQAAERLGASQQDVEAVLTVLQKFDPPGVCARNLSECLAIQLRELNRYDPAMQALVEHLDLLAKRDIASLRKFCGVDDEDITDMIGEIRKRVAAMAALPPR